MSHPYSIVFAEIFKGTLHLYRREGLVAREILDKVISLAFAHGFIAWITFAVLTRAEAMIELGLNEEGISQILEGLATLGGSGTRLARPHYLTLLAVGYMNVGRLDEALSAVEEALAASDENEDRQDEPERYRVKGELLLRRDPPYSIDAGKCFERAIEVARNQSAKSLELRATISLTRLLASLGRRDEARARLAEIYNWFTEGFDTADLKDAKALLDELSNSS